MTFEFLCSSELSQNMCNKFCLCKQWKGWNSAFFQFFLVQIQVLSAKGCGAHDNLRLRPLQVVDVHIQLVCFCSPFSGCLSNSLYQFNTYKTPLYDHLSQAFPNEIWTWLLFVVLDILVVDTCFGLYFHGILFCFLLFTVVV